MYLNIKLLKISMKLGVKLFLPIFFVLFFTPQVFAKIVVVNSENWEDVYSGMLYAKLNNMEGYFLNSPNPEGILRILPKGHEILLIQSDKPFVSTLESILRSKGYEVTTKHVTDATIDLAPDTDTFYIVEKDRAVAALIAAPLAKMENAWVLIVDSENLPKITSMLGGKNVVLVGYFKRNIKSELDKYKTDEIIEPSKFKLSLKVADRFLKKHPTSQVIVTDGRNIEEEIFRGHSPLIIVGSNLLPEETMEWFKENKIKTCVVLGTQLTYVGERIRKASNKQIGVFIKYGQALPGSKIYALSMFPLPTPKIKLNVASVIYDPSTKQVFITFKNSGNMGLFELTNFRILENGNEIASAGDEEAHFIGSGESLVVSYKVSIPASKLNKKLTVEFFTSYGESPDSLDMYLTNIGKFGPPLTKELEVKSINDESLLNVTKVTYYEGYKRIGIEVTNLAKKPAYFIVKLPEIKVQGVPTPLHSEVSFISGDKKEVFISATLDPIDVKENSEVKVVIDYGEKKDLFVKSSEVILPLEVSSGFMPTGLFFYTGVGAGIGIVIIVIVLLLLKKKKRYGYGGGYKFRKKW